MNVHTHTPTFEGMTGVVSPTRMSLITNMWASSASAEEDEAFYPGLLDLNVHAKPNNV